MSNQEGLNPDDVAAAKCCSIMQRNRVEQEWEEFDKLLSSISADGRESEEVSHKIINMACLMPKLAVKVLPVLKRKGFSAEGWRDADDRVGFCLPYPEETLVSLKKMGADFDNPYLVTVAKNGDYIMDSLSQKLWVNMAIRQTIPALITIKADFYVEHPCGRTGLQIFAARTSLPMNMQMLDEAKNAVLMLLDAGADFSMPHRKGEPSPISLFGPEMRSFVENEVFARKHSVDNALPNQRRSSL